MRPRVIITATLLLDAVLFGLNLYVAHLSDSRAVLSQAIYNVTDLVGGTMVLVGYLASQRPPDHEHPFGHGKARFFWSFTASLVSFTIAGLLVILDGLGQVVAPTPVGHLRAALIVLGATLAFSVVGIIVTLRELRVGRTTLSTFLESSHQGLKSIFYQDVVSVFGSMVAFAGIAAVYLTGDNAWDGIAAVVVGALLLITGLVLAEESEDLLIGKAIPQDLARELLVVVERDPRVRQVRALQSMMLGPDDVLIALRVNFRDGLNTDEIEKAIDELGHSLGSSFKSIRHLIIEPES